MRIQQEDRYGITIYGADRPLKYHIMLLKIYIYL